jgi:hypothetical protein
MDSRASRGIEGLVDADLATPHARVMDAGVSFINRG